LFVKEVTLAQGRALANEYGIPFFEASAAHNLNVDEAFLRLASDVLGQIRNNPLNVEELAISEERPSISQLSSAPNIEFQRSTGLIEVQEHQRRSSPPVLVLPSSE
jgi:hypothetical protein